MSEVVQKPMVDFAISVLDAEENDEEEPLNNNYNDNASGKLAPEDDNKAPTPIEAETEAPKPSALCCVKNWLVGFYIANSFLILVLAAILLAKAYPPLGAKYLAPRITATWVAVMIIFLLSGIGLKSEELANAFKRLGFNSFVQIFNFFVVSSVTFGFSRLMVEWKVLPQSLADGLTIATSVPITVNMVLVLTKSAGGDEASAIFNAAFGSLIAVFLSPGLVLMYLGVGGFGSVDVGTVFYKLSLRVILPIVVGQIFRKFSKTVVNFVTKHKPKFKKVQEYALVFIVYCVFCRTFEADRDTSVGDIFIMIGLELFLLLSMMVLAWFGLKLCFPNEPKLRVMGLFGCTHKSVAMGIPLINAIYEESPLVGYYTLPLLIWHPMQLVIGTFIAPRLSAFVKREEERLQKNDLSLAEDNSGDNA